MTWYPAYLDSKQEIVDWCITQVPTLTTGKILDVDVRMADTAIFSYLYKNGRIKVSYEGTTSGATATPADQLNLLWGATLAFNCEFLSYRGIIHFNVGGVQETQIGDIATKFMRMQPMFFMGSNPNNLDPVMPFRSFKQIAGQYLDTYIDLYDQESGGKGFKPQGAWDMSSRGYGANAHDDYRALSDAELTGSI